MPGRLEAAKLFGECALTCNAGPIRLRAQFIIVTRKRTLSAHGRTTTQIRLLALLLLACLSWGATAEFTHSHSTRVNQAALETQTNVAFVSDFDKTTTSKSKSLADCLICQLHQNLSNTVFTHAPATGTIQHVSQYFAAAVAIHRADFSMSQRGRAPPQIL